MTKIYFFYLLFCTIQEFQQVSLSFAARELKNWLSKRQFLYKQDSYYKHSSLCVYEINRVCMCGLSLRACLVFTNRLWAIVVTQ